MNLENKCNQKSNLPFNLTLWGMFKAKRVSRLMLFLSLAALVMGAYPALPALAASGDLDTTFGTNGRAKVGFPTLVFAEPNAMTIQSDGKIVMAGVADNYFALARLNTDGTLDSTFGTAGRVTTTFPDTTYAEVRAIAIQSNGKIVVAGYADGTNFLTYFALARYNTDGTLDTTFSVNGRAMTNFVYRAEASAIAIQANGKILVAGRGTRTSTCLHCEDFALARYNTDGTLDTTFSVNGMAMAQIGDSAEARAIAIQSNGKIVVAGYADGTSSYTSQYIALARYNTDGTLDTTFNGIGKLVTASAGGHNAKAYALALQADGKIVVAGSAYFQADDFESFVLARFNSNGALDTTFSGDGIAVVYWGYYSSARALVIQPNGKLTVAGIAVISCDLEPGFALARLNSDGTLDTTFSDNGKTVTGMGESSATVMALARQTDGKLVAAGASRFYNPTTPTVEDYFSLARYQP